ncbi:DMT family transporter [Thalassobacillus sp. CUG 92003]|uniref:DMT family transporter n=1 Tax=Thalassobacillus sp. CUG 92003 TaxID=2736641 RepID=UPI0015E7C7C8|nr:DMT family transporter [Thalassobacillus sp. CUG 92003]
MKAYGLVLFAIILFSGNFIAGKLAAEAIPPFTLAWFRTFIALLLVLTFARRQFKHTRKTMLQEWKALTGMAITGIVLFPALVYMALDYTTTINASIVEALTPSVAIILSFFFLNERLGKRQLLGVIISFLGVIYIVTQGSLEVLLNLGFNLGDLIMLGAVICWATYSLLVTKHGPKFPLYGSLLFMLLVGNAVLFVVAALGEWMFGGLQIDWSMKVLFSVLYTGIFPAVIALLAWNMAVAMIGPAKTSIFLNLIPVVTAALAFLFLGETIAMQQILGGAFVLLGVFLTTKQNKAYRQQQGSR